MWRVQYAPESAVLSVRIFERLTQRDVRDIADVLPQALSATAGTTFRALFDLRDLAPLEEDVSERLSAVKRAVIEHEGCQGLVVLASSPTVALQQHHSRVRPGSRMELVTQSEEEATRFIAT